MVSELDSWCVVSLNGINAIVKIRHVRRGKFRIIEDSDGKLLIGSIVDASDILNCRVQR
jgi:hypothetical protein